MAPKMLRDCNVEDFAVIVTDVKKYTTTVNKVMYKFRFINIFEGPQNQFLQRRECF